MAPRRPLRKAQEGFSRIEAASPPLKAQGLSGAKNSNLARMKNDTTTRPRQGSERRQKTRLVTSRYDAAEFAELDEAASRAGLTRASFQRVQSLASPKTRSTRRAPIDREMLAKVLGALGKIGSNLNQSTHAAHLERLEKGELLATATQLRATLPLLLEALGRKP